MAIHSITVETSVEHLGGTASEADLNHYLDHIDAALAEAYPYATLIVGSGPGRITVSADSEAEEQAVRDFIQAHFERGGWVRDDDAPPFP